MNWTKLDHIGPHWTELDHIGPHWTTLDQVQFSQLDPDWTQLDQLGPGPIRSNPGTSKLQVPWQCDRAHNVMYLLKKCTNEAKLASIDAD